MRVRLSYSIDVEDLVKEIQRLIDASENKLHNQIGKLRKSRDESDDIDINRFLEQVDKTRQELSKYDQTLEDVFAILQGYIGFLERDQGGEVHEDQELENG